MNFIILGPQGSGKGTQAGLLAKKYNLAHIDMGKALRQIALLNTALGKKIHEIINVKKELVPHRIIEEIVCLELGSVPRNQGVVLDGIPRNMEQVKYLEEEFQKFGRRIGKVFFINIPEKESIKRISKRWMCQKCKSIFSPIIMALWSIIWPRP